MSVTLSVLVDNDAHPPFAKAWGLSILIEKNGNRMLWDTGPDPHALSTNAKLLDKELDVELVILSHRHWDHVGGLSVVRAKEIIAPNDPAFSSSFKLNTDFNEIMNGVIVTRPMRYMGIVEQALLVNAQGYGWVMLVGCSHPKVDRMYEDVVKELGIKPKMVIGGFHLFGERKEVVESTLRNLRMMGAKELHPIHCSGNYAKLLAKSPVETGYVITFKDGVSHLVPPGRSYVPQ